MMKIIEYLTKILLIALTLVIVAVLVGVLFSPDIRGNVVGLVSTLFNEGYIGYFVFISLLFIYYPVYKFIKNIFKVGSIGEALSLSILKNGIEKKIDTAFYLGLPILLLLFYYLGIL